MTERPHKMPPVTCPRCGRLEANEDQVAFFEDARQSLPGLGQVVRLCYGQCGRNADDAQV